MSNITAKSYGLGKRAKDRKAAEKKVAGAAAREKMEFDHANSMEEVKYRQQDAYWAQRIGQQLVKQYPGHGWQVESDIGNGIAKIWNVHVSGQFGWILKLADYRESTFVRDMMRIGGEMLRRSGIKNDKMNPEEIVRLQHDSGYSIKVDLG